MSYLSQQTNFVCVTLDDKKEIYVCKKCDTVFHSLHLIKYHLQKTHFTIMLNEKYSYKCRKCKQKFRTLHLLLKHCTRCGDSDSFDSLDYV